MCVDCGLVIDQIIDDRADHNSWDTHDPFQGQDTTLPSSNCTIGSAPRCAQIGSAHTTANLQRTQKFVRNMTEKSTPSWHANKLAMLNGRICTLMLGTGALLADTTWKMFMAVVGKVRLIEQQRDSVLAVCTYFSMAMTPCRRRSEYEVQLLFSIDVAEFANAKAVVRDVLRNTPDYQQVVCADTGSPLLALTVFVTKCMIAAPSAPKHMFPVLDRVAVAIHGIIVERNILAGCKPAILYPAILHVACDVVLRNGTSPLLSLPEVMNACDVDMRSKATVIKNINVIREYAIACWKVAGVKDDGTSWDEFIATCLDLGNGGKDVIGRGRRPLHEVNNVHDRVHTTGPGPNGRKEAHV